MTVKMKLLFFLLLSLSSTLSRVPHVAGAEVPEASPPTPHLKGLNIDLIYALLSHAGYPAMADTMRSALPTLLCNDRNHSAAFTIFYPPDSPIRDWNNFTLLQYHIVPLKLDTAALESTFEYGSMIDTLLPGHSLAVTTLPGSGQPSINEVKIVDFDIYSDGYVTILGVDRFFDLKTSKADHSDVESDGHGAISKAESNGKIDGFSPTKDEAEKKARTVQIQRLIQYVLGALVILGLLFLAYSIGEKHGRDKESVVLSINAV